MGKYPGKPITFSAESILAILDSRKTQTRRVIKPQPESHQIVAEIEDADGFWIGTPVLNGIIPLRQVKCPYLSEERTLWVREAYRLGAHFDPGATTSGIRREGGSSIPLGILAETNKPTVRYEADERFNHTLMVAHWSPGILHPSIHMPYWAHRIDLDLLNVKVERLRSISEKDCKAEGVDPCKENICVVNLSDLGNDWTFPRFRNSFRKLWDDINLHRGFGWDTDPWVWVLEFKRIV